MSGVLIFCAFLDALFVTVMLILYAVNLASIKQWCDRIDKWLAAIYTKGVGPHAEGESPVGQAGLGR
ncbi:MAG: hypothetical protein LBM66_06010 [Bifidobacteriaceae bacterium]|jgi:hypothetical protein|nr:hypothetical protein [Bifidobacteriaceae bacterium]